MVPGLGRDQAARHDNPLVGTAANPRTAADRGICPGRARLGPDDDADLDERVTTRLDRQNLFDRESPPEVWILIGEPVLGYCVGSAR